MSIPKHREVKIPQVFLTPLQLTWCLTYTTGRVNIETTAGVGKIYIIRTLRTINRNKLIDTFFIDMRL